MGIKDFLNDKKNDQLKDKLYGIEKESLSTIGLIIPYNNIIITDKVKNHNYNPEDKKIYINKTKIQEESDIVQEYDVTHESGHLIIDFILNSGININNFTKEELQQSLRNFYKREDIVITEEQYNKFKSFIDKSPFKDKDFYKHLEFDDKFYVSGVMVKNYIKDNPQDRMAIFIYLNNSSEIFSHFFATKLTFQKYEKMELNNKRYVALSKLSDKLKNIIDVLPKEIVKSKNDFIKHLQIYNLYFHSTDNQPIYSDYNFIKSNKILDIFIKEIQQIGRKVIDINKTPEQLQQEQQEIEDTKETILYYYKLNNVTIIDNYESTEINKDRYLFTKHSNIKNQLNDILSQTKMPFIKEIVVDLPNKTNYLFHTERQLTTKEREQQNKDENNDHDEL